MERFRSQGIRIAFIPTHYLALFFAICAIGCAKASSSSGTVRPKRSPRGTAIFSEASGSNGQKAIGGSISQRASSSGFGAKTSVIKPMRHGLPQTLIMLTYHDIIPVRNSNSLWFDCSVSELKNQLETMKKAGCHFVSVGQIYRYLTDGTPLPSHPVGVTFADGYEGVYKYGIPILRKYHIPATEFIHTGYVGSPIGRPKMTWSQIEELDKKGLMTFGSQTVTHPANLPSFHGAKLMYEMTASRAALEEHLHHPVLWLAYPDGNFDAEDEAAAKKAGYVIAFSEHQEPSNLSPNIYSVNRYVHTKWRIALKALFK